MKTSIGAKDILFPVPVTLIVCGEKPEFNIVTVAWIGIVGSSPPSLAISLNKNRHSVKLLRKTKEFTVNIPKTDDMKLVDYCGLVSGKNTNKFEDTKFTPMDSKVINVPIIKECPFNIECTIKKEIDMNEWLLFIAEIENVLVDSDKIDGKKILVAKIDPLVYIPTIREYWSLGSFLGDSFKVGRKPKNHITPQPTKPK